MALAGAIVQPIAAGRRLAASALFVIIAHKFRGWLRGVTGLAVPVPLVLPATAVCTHVRAWRPIAEVDAVATRVDGTDSPAPARGSRRAIPDLNRRASGSLGRWTGTSST